MASQFNSQSEIHQLKTFDIPEAEKKIKDIKSGICPDNLHDWSVYLIKLQNKLLTLLKETVQ